VPQARDVDHVEIVFLDDPVHVRVNEVLPGRRSPVAEQYAFDILQLQRPFEQRIGVEADLADRKIVGELAARQ